MNPLIYKIIHLAGVMGLFSALGAIIAGTCFSCKKSARILHGISLLLILISGFGMIAKLGYGYTQGWIICKIVIWLILGAMLALSKKANIPPPILMAILLLSGLISAWLGVMKPF